jgi:peptide/nickel transport system substrate-binding protein
MSLSDLTESPVGQAALSRRRLLSYGAAAVPAATLGFAASEHALAQDDGETPSVSIAQGVDIATFDPPDDTSASSRSIFQNVFDQLVELDDDLQFVPSLAESWTNIDDLTWEFKIRQGVLFHDGSELTAHDVKFSFDVILDPDEGRRQKINLGAAGIERVEAPDDYTVRIITAEPYAPLVRSNRFVSILPAKTYQEMGREAFALNPVGTGPFRVVEWVKDTHIQLEAFEDHWRGAPAIKAAEFRPIPEASTRVAALRAGEIDLATLVPPSEIPVVDGEEGTEIRTVPSVRTIFVGINTSQPPLDDVRVRQAMNYAVDVEAIVQFILDGHGFPMASVSGPAEFGHNPELEPYPYDPDRARALLAEAGVESLDLTLHTPSGRYLQDVEVCQAIAGQLAEVGINVEVRPAEFQQFFSAYLANELDGLHFLGYGSAQLDADGVLGAHLETGSAGEMYYSTPESDEMIRAARRDLDEESRLARYYELMAHLHDDAPWIFMYNQEDIYGVNRSLAWTPKSDERLWVPQMEWAQE